MAYGRAALGATCVTQQDHELLQDVLSLLAYDEPEKSPSGDMLGSKAREDLAAALNGAVLRSKGRMQESALERLLQHGVGCSQLYSGRVNLPCSAVCQACCAHNFTFAVSVYPVQLPAKLAVLAAELPPPGAGAKWQSSFYSYSIRQW